ncbi:RimK-like ATP-grasp domain-containing protein [Lutibacter oricola]|uniref:RimK-like ATP-grasp domain-containing protein n=1 Tax=Lutibacter oricola TaxID=762486 RepID=A0A1H3CE58_9FLAO|nr:hypothetical protein [Lutibacter oricola]SDX51789.1 RimK-like ATP-grasp domain-containing protein [Lutibacter oricola]
MAKINLTKLTNWEYWPWYMFYIPNLPYAIYLAIKAKSLVFFSATNPCISHSGNGSESKYKTLELIPKKFIPKTIFIQKNETFKWVLNQILENNLEFPLIIKPDIGFRGLLVKQIHSTKDLEEYLAKNNCIDLILQDFIDYKNECGIFYHRIPTEENGKISSITLKKFLTVHGDGKTTLENLILNDDRAQHYIDLLREIHKEKLQKTPYNNEEVLLTVIGNHAKGTQFLNGNHLISKELEDSIDAFMKQIPGFYYGRLDLKFNSFENIIKQNEFKVLEINGIIAEPTHIYDASKNTYFNALKGFRKHWKIMYKTAIANNKKGIMFDSVSDFLGSLKQLKKYTSFIKKHSLSS